MWLHEAEKFFEGKEFICWGSIVKWMIQPILQKEWKFYMHVHPTINEATSCLWVSYICAVRQPISDSEMKILSSNN